MMQAGSTRGPGWTLLPVGLGLLVGLLVAVQPALVPVALVGLLGVAVALRAPQLLVVMIFVSILFDRLGVTGSKVANFPVTFSKLAVLGSLGLWALYVVLYRVRPLRWHPVLSAMVGLTVATALCVAASGDMVNGRFPLIGMAMMTVLVGLSFTILSDRPLPPIYRLLGGVVVLALATSVLQAGGAGEAGRATGTFGDPNEWATLVLLVTPLLLGGLADDPHWLARPLRLALVGLAPLAILSSGSRAALVVGAGVGLGSLYLMRGRKGELGLCLGGALVAGPLVVDIDAAMVRFGRLVHSLRGDTVVEDESLSERGELFRQGVDLFLENWLLGAGPGNFARATGFVSITGKLRPAHNSYLEVAGEMGLVGLVALAVFGLTVFASLWRSQALTPRTADRNRVLGAGLGLLALCLMAATLGLLTFSMAYLMLGLALAIGWQARLERPLVG